MHTVLHSLIHALKDCALTLPFLFAAYLIMEFFEHRTEIKLSKILSSEKLGPVGGAIVGCIPQCGMGVLSSHLFSSGIISAGALIAVFISTSDEALPIILSHPDKILAVFPLLLVKIAAAVIAGYLFDLLYRRSKHKKKEHSHNSHGECHSCEEIHHLQDHRCGEKCGDSIFVSALKRTVVIFLYIYAVSFVFEILVELIGENTISSFLSSSYLLQPIFAALVGLIPNCAISVIITELYLSNAIGFGAVIAGLSTGAGVGFITLFKTNKSKKECFVIMIYILLFSILFGEIIQLLLM